MTRSQKPPREAPLGRTGLTRDSLLRERDLLWSRGSLEVYLTDEWWRRETSYAGYQGINDHAVAANLNYVLGDRQELKFAVTGIVTLMRWTFLDRLADGGPSNAVLCLRAGLPWLLWSGEWELAAKLARYRFAERPNTMPSADFPESEMKRWCFLAQWLAGGNDDVLRTPGFLALTVSRCPVTRVLAVAMRAVGNADSNGFNGGLAEYIERSRRSRCTDLGELISPDATTLAHIAEHRGIHVVLDQENSDCIAATA